MRRKAFCVVADIEPRRFDTLMTRGQVPFRKDEEGWGQYSLDDAFRLRLMLDLVDEGGCEIGAAIVAQRMALTTHWLDTYPLVRNAPNEDTWIAIGSIAYQQGDDFVISQEFLAGSVWGIPKMLQGVGENHAETTGMLTETKIVEGENGPDILSLPVKEAKYWPGRIIMANASLAARKVIQNAESLEIELTDDDFPTFPKDAPNALCDVADAADGWQKHLKRIKGDT